MLLVLQGRGEESRDRQTDAQTEAADGEHFNSFQFWREPTPIVSNELLALLVSEVTARTTGHAHNTSSQTFYLLTG